MAPALIRSPGWLCGLLRDCPAGLPHHVPSRRSPSADAAVEVGPSSRRWEGGGLGDRTSRSALRAVTCALLMGDGKGAGPGEGTERKPEPEREREASVLAGRVAASSDGELRACRGTRCCGGRFIRGQVSGSADVYVAAHPASAIHLNLRHSVLPPFSIESGRRACGTCGQGPSMRGACPRGCGKRLGVFHGPGRFRRSDHPDRLSCSSTVDGERWLWACPSPLKRLWFW